MNKAKKPTAVEKRAKNPDLLAPFDLENLKHQLPLSFPLDPDIPPSPKRRYRSAYRYPGFEGLLEGDLLETGSSFEIAIHLIDYSNLEPLLARHIYVDSAKGQIPFHPVSMFLLSMYRREHDLSRNEVLRILRHEEEGRALRRWTGFEKEFPSESGLRHFEKQITSELQREINALQIDMLYQAGLLPVKPGTDGVVDLSFDGMLHHARSRMRCSSVQAGCYEPSPRPCPARDKGRRGCDCRDDECAQVCRYAAHRDPEARLVVYSGRNKRGSESPNAPLESDKGSTSVRRKVFGYYSYAGQILDDELSTYWILPAAFGPATCGDEPLFLDNFAYLQSRFPWLKTRAVIADAGICTQNCLDSIWKAGALRIVDIRAHETDKDPETCLARGYDENGYPLCPLGYTLRPNGHDYQRRRTKWRCAKQCLSDPEQPPPDCDYLQDKYKHGYTTTVGRTHADGSVRLAREIPYNSPVWKELYNRRSMAESRNAILEHFGLKRLPVHGFVLSYVTILQGDFLANQHTLVRLVREATALR